MAYDFDRANNQYLEEDAAPVTAAPITIAGWFFFEGGDNDDFAIVQIGDKDTSSNYFRLNVDTFRNAVTAVINSTSGGITVETTTEPSGSTWHHACYVGAAVDDHAVFLNGGSKGTSTTSITPISPDRYSIGREGDSSPGDAWDGKLAEVSVWNVALTDIEVGILAAGYSAKFVRPQNLITHHRLIRNINDDMGGSSLSLSASAPTAFNDHPRIIYPTQQHIESIAAAVPAAVLNSYKSLMGVGL